MPLDAVWRRRSVARVMSELAHVWLLDRDVLDLTLPLS
jgi:hypothetical protein